MSVALLRESYLDTTRKNGLIDFTKKVRGQKNDFSGKYQIKLNDLDTLFSDTVWEDERKKGGHRKLINRVTRIVIEYKHHGKNTVDPGAAKDIFDQVQLHLDILCDQIFAYSGSKWGNKPNYEKASTNLSRYNNTIAR
ncbi:MAG: hypothetical protein KR126chlam4_01176 [Candidatus Anoxychlamydiales bacterium]|uniref:Uncharacterized protein n=1 Tax=marine sediment metagenome TaxID=412755 RepID=A0A0F9D8N7_9ZZZZ|nr:hypothetical protein [Candidatus Anoxychlamydiales bacterium]NGX41337.1 hypothetical protein [Candidatus Anoxychlamydiales bacterium]HEU64397.1 type II toxin-antitoxin system HicA family toxin [Chlamydiota bacterium]